MDNKYKVLLVDDDDDILWVNEQVLKLNGFQVCTSPSPEEALRKTQSERFHVAILDYMLPDMRGDELAMRVEGLDRGIEVIFLTGYSEFVDYLRTVNERKYTVLLKPVSPEELVDAVKAVVSKKSSTLNVDEVIVPST